MSFYDREPDLSVPRPSNSAAKSAEIAAHARMGEGTVPEANFDAQGSDRMIQDCIAQANRPKKNHK